MHRIPRAELYAALLVTASTTAAFAHVTLERREATPNASYRAVVQVNHGCSGKPTNRVSVTVPEGVIGARPMPKPGWELTTEKGPYARAYPYYHGDVGEGVKTITWSGGSLPDDQVDEFTFLARVTDTFAPGSTVYFPVQQDCTQGSHSWSEIPAPGQEARSLKAPAPGVTIVAAGPQPATTGATPAVVKAGDLAIETPWMRATPAGAKVAGGYVRITNTGKESDRLTGAAIPLAGSASVHSMSMDGGVMRMAVVEGGLTIAPGATVELKPGGYHLMFEDLKGTPKAGEAIAGSLIFARAGTVAVTFAVAPIGAKGPDGKGPDGKATGSKPSGHHDH
ncbi:DUF1775 domain-containing protein [Methylobacterium sp. Leaf466]|uniref:DUF1775 domain-containing protein n=1 Tax=Methylobacterium sp. Leaf466 TaxID=1736386 RepID=UPI0006FD2EB6|nr:DUF1775 domain-containing protein [Methylobacterium sp. Leaf466]KQT90578.1 copper resistance protein CopZ [Methylobacterium sp. Leaf466]